MDENKRNIVIIGDGYVGKSSILNAIKGQTFDDQIPNVYDDFEWTETINGKQYRLKFIDTAGQEEYSMIRKLYYKEANVFLLCFAVDDKISYENMETKWVPELEGCDDIPIILLGTKSDLRNGRTKCISRDEIIRFQKRIGAPFYVECSAKSLAGIDELKQKILKFLFKQRSCVIQ